MEVLPGCLHKQSVVPTLSFVVLQVSSGHVCGKSIQAVPTLVLSEQSDRDRKS